MKWVAVGVGAIALLAGGFVLFGVLIANPRVIEELRSSPHGDRARKVMLLTLPSGRTIPVNYLREGEFVYAGADGRWWRELRGDGVEVVLEVMGETFRGHARAVEDDPEHTRDIFSRLRPTVPSWLPDWLNAVLVEIRLPAEPAP